MATEAGSRATGEVSAVVHVELPADDAPKLVDFYHTVFGWQFGTAPGAETHHVARTTADGAAYAIFPKEPDAQRVNYIGVSSVKEHAAKVAASGGSVIHRFSVPRFGHGAICLDPEGNSIALWQQDPTATETPS